MEKGKIIEKIKILIVFTLLMTIFFFSLTSSDKTAYAQEYTPVVTVGEKTAHRGQTFTVDVDLTDNQGLISLYLSLSYDSSVMKLTNVEQGDGLKDLTFTNTNSQTEVGYGIVPFNLLWDGRTIDRSNGRLVRLTFESFSDAPVGTYPITLTYQAENTNSSYGHPVAIDIDNGSVTLIKGEYEAIYYDWDGTELYRKDYNAEESPSFVGELPSRTEDERYSYAFNGWKGIVSDSVNVLMYQADYILTPKVYQVFYYVDGMNETSFDGRVTTDDFYKAKTVAYGDFLDLEYPSKPRYVFSGWFTDAECLRPFNEVYMPANDLSLYGFFVYDIRTTSIPKIQLSAVENEEQKTVTVYANMVVNTGFNAMVLTLDYDRSALEFVGFEKKETFSALQFDTTNTENVDAVDNFRFYYEHSENTYETGLFLEMTFNIKNEATAGVYDVTFTLDNEHATYINGTNGIRYTKINVIGSQVAVGKIYEWEKNAEDNAEIKISSDFGMPADTVLKVSLIPERVHNIEALTVTEVAGEDMEIKAVYNLRLLRVLGEVETEVQPNGKLTIEIKLTKEQQACTRLALYYVNDNGEMTLHDSVREGDVLRFETDHLSWWAVVGDKATATGRLSDAAVMLITMPILLAIATMAFTLIVLGKHKKEREKEREKERNEE